VALPPALVNRPLAPAGGGKAGGDSDSFAAGQEIFRHFPERGLTMARRLDRMRRFLGMLALE